MSIVGFGSYRISIKSKKHSEALKYALDSGCSVIDTSTIYTGGESEQLIGEVLKDLDEKPFIISKCGYIQGSINDELDELNKNGKATQDIVEFSEGLKHSIHPDFINDQLERSLSRLMVETIDVYLLHNPEYYLKTEGSSEQEYYRRIKDAFICLEEKVSQGKIKAYGVSSNTFVNPKEDHTSTDLDKVYQIAKEIAGDKHHFKFIQFPLNLLEMGALERQYEGQHLIERGQELGLKTMINRPLNALTEHGLVRLANYEVDAKHTDEFANEQFHLLIKPLVKRWESNKEELDEKLFELPFMSNLQHNWFQQPTPDAVDHLFMQYFFPFVAQVWGTNLSATESQAFYDLYDLAILYSRKNMNERANVFKKQAIDKGLLYESEMDLSQMAIEKYQTFGVDYILVGMRDKKYVDKMINYF